MDSKISDKHNPIFDIQGVNHFALVCKDMKKTVDFYQGVLGMPLIKTCDLPFGLGQHFFFDIGRGASLAFFWFPEAPAAIEGVTVTRTLMGKMGDVTTAVGSLNHVAFNVDSKRLVEYKAKLEAAGVEVAGTVHHDDTDMGVSLGEPHKSNWVSSIYFKDPDGIQLEFAGWTRPMTAADVAHEAATEADKAKYLELQKSMPTGA